MKAAIIIAVVACVLAGCGKKEQAVDYVRAFEGRTADDVRKFTEESGLMRTPDWDAYAIGYDAYLVHCTEDDLYSKLEVCNLDQIRGAKARTLFWQFLSMGERVLNEEAIAQIRYLEAAVRKAGESGLDRESLTRRDSDPLSHTIHRISDLKRVADRFDRIQAIKAKMPQ